jgi:hypothetical protein
MRSLCLYSSLEQPGLSNSFHAASFAVMPRWCFIGLGIFYEMVALKIRYHAFSSVRHSLAV